MDLPDSFPRHWLDALSALFTKVSTENLLPALAFRSKSPLTFLFIHRAELNPPFLSREARRGNVFLSRMRRALSLWIIKTVRRRRFREILTQFPATRCHDVIAQPNRRENEPSTGAGHLPTPRKVGYKIAPRRTLSLFAENRHFHGEFSGTAARSFYDREFMQP